MQQQSDLPMQSTAGNPAGGTRNEFDALNADLQEMEDLYQNAPCGFHSVDRNRLILKINDTELKWLGYQREEVVGKLSIDDLVAPESHAALAQCFACLLAGEAILDKKIRMRRKNGESFSVSANASALLDASGNLLIVRGTMIDTSEREQIEAELRASEESFRSAFENAAIGMALVMPDGRLLKVNEALCRMLGYVEQDLLSRSCQALTHPDDIDAECNIQQQLLTGKFGFYHVKRRCIHKDGHTVLGCLSITLVRNTRGLPLHFVVLMEDITEREKMLTALRMSEERFRGAFQHATIGMALAGLDGRWTKVNHALCQILGYTEQQLLSKVFLDVTHPDDVQISNTRARQLLSGELSYYHLEKRYIHSDGHIVWTFASGTLVRDAQGVPLHYVGMVEDITERRKAEAALQLSQEKLRELVAHQERIKENERARIAREIHDELGGVLTGIRANLSVAMHQDERAGRAPNQRLLDACALVDTAVETVRRVITDLRPSVLDQLGVWTALEWIAEQTEARSGFCCRVSIDASAAQSVIDAERSTVLFRIVQETLSNVARHADASQVEIRVSRENGAIRMEVEDNGKGISAEQLLNRKSWGIAGMVERARYFGGDIRIADTSHGTLLVLRLPLENLND